MAITADYKPQAILAQRDNVAVSASLTAAGVRAAPADEVTAYEPVIRGGTGDSTGRVKLTGSHTGETDVDVRVRITGSGSTTRPSEPTFSGVGSGTLSSVTVPAGLTPQTFTLTLKARDPDPQFASGTLGGYEIRAVVAGAEIDITATRNLLQSAPIANLVLPLAADQSESESVEHDFGGAFELNAFGEYAPSTLRIQFGTQPEVYRQHLEEREGKTTIVFSPPIVRAVPAGTPVYSVSGDYNVSVTDGTDTENYPGLTTQFDLLSQLLDSQLARPVQPVLPDKTPGGITVTDVQILSSPTLLNVALGGEYMEQPTAVALGAGIKTGQYIATVASADGTSAGNELWEWRGPTGFIGTSRSGAVFSAADLTATIPQLEPTVLQDSVEPYITGESFEAENNGDEIYPRPCFVGGAGVGWAVRPSEPAITELTFVWTNRPSDECNCDNATVEGRLDPTCLGLDPAQFGGTALYTGNVLEKIQLLGAWFESNMPQQWESQTITEYEGPLNRPENFADTYFITSGLVDRTSATELSVLEYAYNRLRRLAIDIAELGPVDQESGGTKTGAQAWDEAFSAVQSSPAISAAIGAAQQLFDPRTAPANINRMTESIIVNAYHKVALDPKDDATGGDGWWRDYGDSAYFRVFDQSGRELAPLFAGKPWYSAIERIGEDGEHYYEDTQQVALHIRVGCQGSLIKGDTFRVNFGAVDIQALYKKGDKIIFDVIAGRPVRLRGGVAGGSARVFGVRGSVAGALEDYNLDVDAPTAYVSATIPGLSWLITEGGIKFQLGDAYTFTTDRNQYQVSTDGGGSYSSAADIPTTSVAVLGPLTAEFIPGPGVSFADGDEFRMLVEQPYAPVHALTPDDKVYDVQGALDLVIDFGSDQSVDLIALICESGVTVQLLDATDTPLALPLADMTTPTSTVMVGRSDPNYTRLISTVTARKLRLTAADLTGNPLRWVWAGAPFAVMRADQVQPRRQRVMARGNGINAQELPIGLGYGVDLSWRIPGPTAGFLRRDDLLALRELMDYLTLNPQPVIVIPNKTYGDAFLCRWETDTLSDLDRFRYQPADSDKQALECAVSFAPEYAC